MKYRSVTGYTTRSYEDTHINSFSAISVEKRLKNVKFEEQLRKSNFFYQKTPRAGSNRPSDNRPPHPIPSTSVFLPSV